MNSDYIQPLISIIIPIYNAAPYLVRTFGALQNQTYSHLEILLVDDGSADNSLELCNEFASRDSRVHVLHHDNQGASFTRNRGIESAKGDYIMFVDADDSLSPYAVESLLQASLAHHADISVGDVAVIHDGEEPEWEKPEGVHSTPITCQQAYKRLARYEWWGPVAKLYKSCFLKKFRFPKETLSEDYFLMVQMFHQAKMCHQPGTIYAYIKRAGSLSTETRLTPRSLDEVINTFHAWQYCMDHAPQFSNQALVFCAESCVKVAQLSNKASTEAAAVTWKKVQATTSRIILPLTLNKLISWKLKILSWSITLGKLPHRLLATRTSEPKKKKILILTHTLHGGGVEQSLKVLLHTINFYQHEVTLLSLLKEDLKNDFPDFIHYSYIYESLSDSDNALHLLYKRIKNKYRVWVYTHCSPQLFYRLFMPKGHDTELAYIEGDCTRIISGSNSSSSKKLAWIHCDMREHHWSLSSYKNKKEEQEAYARFDHVCVVSTKAMNVAKEMFPSVTRWELTPNIIPIESIRKKANQKPEAPVEKTNGHHLCYVGRLEKVKGIERLLTAYETVSKGFKTPVYLHIVGDGSLLQSLQNYTTDRGLSNVKFYGLQTNPYPYMKMADWLVCPSFSEGYGLVLAEALIVGTPVISTNCVGTAEILHNGHFGILTKNSTEGLILALSRVLKNEDLHSFYTRKSQEWVSQFATNKNIKIIESLIL